MRRHKNNNRFRLITSSKSAAPLNLFVNKLLYGLCPSRKLRVYETTINLYFGVNVELAHVKSTALNCLNKTLFTKRRARGINEKT